MQHHLKCVLGPHFYNILCITLVLHLVLSIVMQYIFIWFYWEFLKVSEFYVFIFSLLIPSWVLKMAPAQLIYWEWSVGFYFQIPRSQILIDSLTVTTEPFKYIPWKIIHRENSRGNCSFCVTIRQNHSALLIRSLDSNSYVEGNLDLDNLRYIDRFD